ncbi:hypothetical protein GPALN_013337 [Globodera pallida]|nr:hypothetical protein GPALN_013337 [Globodera pallida]
MRALPARLFRRARPLPPPHPVNSLRALARSPVPKGEPPYPHPPSVNSLRALARPLTKASRARPAANEGFARSPGR